LDGVRVGRKARKGRRRRRRRRSVERDRETYPKQSSRMNVW
jgi:hypothetical protein